MTWTERQPTYSCVPTKATSAGSFGRFEGPGPYQELCTVRSKGLGVRRYIQPVLIQVRYIDSCDPVALGHGCLPFLSVQCRPLHDASIPFLMCGAHAPPSETAIPSHSPGLVRHSIRVIGPSCVYPPSRLEQTLRGYRSCKKFCQVNLLSGDRPQ